MSLLYVSQYGLQAERLLHLVDLSTLHFDLAELLRLTVPLFFFLLPHLGFIGLLHLALEPLRVPLLFFVILLINRVKHHVALSDLGGLEGTKLLLLLDSGHLHGPARPDGAFLG